MKDLVIVALEQMTRNWTLKSVFCDSREPVIFESIDGCQLFVLAIREETSKRYSCRLYSWRLYGRVGKEIIWWDEFCLILIVN